MTETELLKGLPMLTLFTFLALWFAASVVTVGTYSLARWLHSYYEASVAPDQDAR